MDNEEFVSEFAMVSVQHTGTHFLDALVREHYPKARTTHWITVPNYLRKKRIICPIRNPYDCFVTWYSRNSFGVDFFSAWHNFNDAFVAGNIESILPIDTPDRDEYLQELSKVIDRPLKTDWAMKGSMARFKPPKVDLSEIYELPVVQKFYKEL